MKRVFIIVVLLGGLGRMAADIASQYGRIWEIKKSTSSYTKTWVANTPIMEEVTTYTISVQVGKALLVGTYDISEQQPQPPPDWGKGYAVKVQEEGDLLSVRSVTGQLRLHLKQRKTGKPMDPLAAAEKKRLDELDAPLQSLIGFSSEGSSKGGSAKGASQAASEPAPPAPSPAPLATGTVTVRSTPYLSEVFVDGESMGYTPAKIALPPGKHTFRVEKPGYKPWTKEMTITGGSDLTLDASLARK
ncbi:MAG: PEGA domain-containing protein [Acidobacteriia bacterium]|nr:PEGA domain-containing protein [Terriglobia bacterium]